MVRWAGEVVVDRSGGGGGGGGGGGRCEGERCEGLMERRERGLL